MARLARLFTIRTKLEAFLVIYAIALGAVERGRAYQLQYDGVAGWLLFTACLAVVFVAGGKLIDAIDAERRLAAGPEISEAANASTTQSHPRWRASGPSTPPDRT